MQIPTCTGCEAPPKLSIIQPLSASVLRLTRLQRKKKSPASQKENRGLKFIVTWEIL